MGKLRMLAVLFGTVLSPYFCAAVPGHQRGGCTTDADCSLNGVCEPSGCRCDAGWRGDSCAVLDLLPVSPETRGKVWPPDNRTSSWGANIVWRGDRWSMVASEMGGHCGLGSWQHNSFLRRASSRQLHIGGRLLP